MLNDLCCGQRRPEDGIKEAQKIGVKRCPEKRPLPEDIARGYLLCPEVVIEGVDSGRIPAGEIRLDLEEIDQSQQKGQGENHQRPDLL